MIDYVLENFWIKLFVAFLLSLFCVFAKYITTLQSTFTILINLFILLLLVFNDMNNSFGIILLLISLTILLFNDYNTKKTFY